jgi:hypothetical protein
MKRAVTQDDSAPAREPSQDGEISRLRSLWGFERYGLFSSIIRYNPVGAYKMHPLIEQIEELFLPELERLASQLQGRFPALRFKILDWRRSLSSQRGLP